MGAVDNNGTNIHYEVSGSGPPLILQHGRLGSGQFWEEFGYVAALQDQRTVITVDARGHGRSDKPHDPDAYHQKDMASDVVRVLDDLDIETADFFGYSMGGRIGFMCLAFFGERFNSLIAGGAGPYGPAVSREAELGLADSLADGMATYLDNLDRMLNRTLPEADRAALMANDAEALAALARGTADWSDASQEVAATAVPIQLFGGSVDPIWPLIERANGQLPTSEIHCFDGLGHGEELRQPKLLLPLVIDFLARHGLER
ncbi:MAG: alpha/beta fold hydrolase [Acidimicrobiales bacterium]